MNKIIKILGILLILAAVSLSGCIGEDVTADNETEVVVVDDPADIISGDPVVDVPVDIVEDAETVTDKPKPIISKPSSSGNLVAGVDGQPGHGAEIRAKREAAEAARIAMLNALADDLPNARDSANNASANFTDFNGSYVNETILMDAFLVAENNLYVANESTKSALTNLTNAEASYEDDMITYNASVENCIVHGIDAPTPHPEDPANCTCLEIPSTVGFQIPALKNTLLFMEGQEASAQLDLNAAVDDRGVISDESIEAARLMMEEARVTMEEAFAYLEECQAAFDMIHPVAEPEE